QRGIERLTLRDERVDRRQPLPPQDQPHGESSQGPAQERALDLRLPSEDVRDRQADGTRRGEKERNADPPFDRPRGRPGGPSAGLVLRRHSFALVPMNRTNNTSSRSPTNQATNPSATGPSRSRSTPPRGTRSDKPGTGWRSART